jgi:acetyltransferase
MRRLAGTIAEAAQASSRTFVAYQYTPLGGPLDAETIGTLHAAHVPVLLGTTNAMRALRYLPMRRGYWARAARPSVGEPAISSRPIKPHGEDADFLTLRAALVSCGVPVVEAALAWSADEAVVIQQQLAVPVALKAQAPGLVHKSDVGGVCLDCATAADVARAYCDILQNVRRAGFETAQILVQPMVKGVAEAYAGVIDDVLLGPAICFGLGGIFVELGSDVAIEMAPLSREGALAMIRSVKGSQILGGARGRQKGDIEALADLLVRLGDFALAHAGGFRALDLNPIIVKPEGVVAVDIALESNPRKQTSVAASAAR